ncbi:tetratricopeptide repeat protein 31 [Spea bombifrons]|uniref:tetratricopeptide repeat protein 31 n=1 Tax=Spea bombifrons TaxID=233779 RepID=UPI00234B776A|nr:tetratricopeptide repeat protein 31 [Spea bombifrons]
MTSPEEAAERAPKQGSSRKCCCSAPPSKGRRHGVLRVARRGVRGHTNPGRHGIERCYEGEMGERIHAPRMLPCGPRGSEVCSLPAASDDDFLDDYSYFNDGDEDDDDDDGRAFAGGPNLGPFLHLHPSFLYPHQLSFRLPVTQEEADRNALELLQEEEKERQKLEKKRLKKKRQKERKRQQKAEGTSHGTGADKDLDADPNDGTDADEESESEAELPLSAADLEAGLDLQSSFVRQAQQRMGNNLKPQRKESASERSRERRSETSKERDPPKPLAPSKEPSPVKGSITDLYRVQQSLDLANIGNNLASRERFLEAANYYTEAIKLNPAEYRFLGNRSYSYERCGRYQEALRDADQALQLQPHFIKGHFRKGKALKGLQRYSEAIAAFQKVLLSDINHTEAAAEIAQCQTDIQAQITRVNVNSNCPLNPPPTPPESSSGKGLVIRNSRYTIANGTVTTPKSATKQKLPPAKQPPTLSSLYPVWVGNVTNKITEDVLRATFEPFGPVHSMRILYSRTCAFINYTGKKDAERAFQELQGRSIEGTTLVLQLRNPEHSNLKVPGAKQLLK